MAVAPPEAVKLGFEIPALSVSGKTVTWLPNVIIRALSVGLVGKTKLL